MTKTRLSFSHLVSSVVMDKLFLYNLSLQYLTIFIDCTILYRIFWSVRPLVNALERLRELAFRLSVCSNWWHGPTATIVFRKLSSMLAEKRGIN